MEANLSKLISGLKEKEALLMVEKLLGAGDDPLEILGQARKGMEEVGEKFAAGDYFIPDLVYSGEILSQVVKIVEPLIKKQKESESLGKIVFGTVAGDIHDIGKNIVTFMLDINGFEVIDVGIDVPVQTFVDTIKETKPQVVGLSGFLTLAFDSMKETITAIREAGNKDMKIMIGGGQIDDVVMKYTGADAWGNDAMDAVNIALSWARG